jgi:hypothetical protein
MLDRLHHRLDRPRARWLLLGVAVVLVVVAGAAVELLRIRRDLDEGRQLLTSIDLTTLDEDGELAAIADGAADHIDDAARLARTSPVLRALSVIPVLGRQVDALRDLTGAVAELGGHGREAASAIEASLDAGSGPEGRLEVVRAARRELADLRDHLAAVDLGAHGWLLPPLAAARRDLAIDLADARSDLERSTRLAVALEGFLEGPRRYLVLGGNNAEMRAVGIPTTSGVAEIRDGAIEMGEFRNSEGPMELPEPGVPVPLEYEALYGWLNGDRGYRTTLTTANWPVAARISADITAQNPHGPVEGIIYVDTITLAVLLDVIGPVEVHGTTYSRDNVLEELLYRNYLRYQTLEDNPERQALQGDIAHAIFDALDQRDFSVLQLAGNLAALARGRHLLAWSEDPAENALWEAFGADGALRPDGIGVVSVNLNPSKLDYFVRQEVAIEAEREGDHRRVTLRVTLINPEHPETSPYIDGGGLYAEPGEYGSFLLAYLPRDAYDIGSEAGFTHYGPDGPSMVVGTILRVPEGTEREVVIEFSVPEARERLQVLPSTRLLGTLWHVGDDDIVDAEPFEIDLTDLD